MWGLESIGNLLAKRAVSLLIKAAIDKFDTSKTTLNQIKLLIKELEKEISLETKLENKQVKTEYRLSNLYNYYKLAKAYERQLLFEDILGVSKEKMADVVLNIEIRLESLEKPNG